MNDDIKKIRATVKFVNDLNFTDEEIDKYYYKIIQINEDLCRCESSSSEKCINDDELHEIFCRDKNNKLFSTLIKCKKFTDKPKSHLENYLIKEFDYHWDDLFFTKENIKVGNKSRKVLINELLNQLKKNDFKNLYVYSNTNVGKTYLFALFCNSLAALNKKICFVNFSKFLLDFKRTSNNWDSFNDMVNKLDTCDVLVIDSLGLDKFNSYIIIENLLPIIIIRKNRGLPTYFISYLSLEKLELKYINDVKSSINYNMNTKLNLDPFKNLIKKFINTIRSSLDEPEFLLEENE